MEQSNRAQNSASKQSNRPISQRTILLNRKQTQVEFLMQENGQLKQDIQDLNNLIKTNKEALNTFIQNENQKQDNKKKQQSEIECLQKVMKSLYSENNQILTSIERLINERNLANAKALITEQMLDVAERQSLENSKEQEAKLAFLQQQIKDYAQTLEEYKKKQQGQSIRGMISAIDKQKNKNNISQVIFGNENQDYVNNDLEINQVAKVITKYREVMQPNEQVLKMYEDLQQFNCLIDFQQMKLKFLQEQNEKLQKINIKNGETIISLQKQLDFFNQNVCKQCEKYTQQVTDISSIQDIIQYHRNLMNINKKEILEKEIEQRMLSPLQSPLPDRVNYIQKFQSVPLLDLSKAFKIQQLNISKHTMQCQKQLFAQPKERLQKEILIQREQLDETRNQLAVEMLACKKLERENESLKQDIQYLENTNETLLYSQNLYEVKWKKLYQAFKFYRNFYKQKKDEVNHNSQNYMNQEQNIFMDGQETNRMIRQQEKQGKDDLNNNKSIMEINWEDDVSMNQFQDMKFVNRDLIYQQFNGNKKQNNQNKDQAVQYLMTLAKSLYNNYNQNSFIGNQSILQGVNQQGSRSKRKNRIKRSNSNPNLQYQSTSVELNNDTQKIQQQNQNKQQNGGHKKNVSVFLPGQQQSGNKCVNFEENGALDYELGPNESKYLFTTTEQDDEQNGSDGKKQKIRLQNNSNKKINNLDDLQDKIKFDPEQKISPQLPSMKDKNQKIENNTKDKIKVDNYVHTTNNNETDPNQSIDNDKSYNYMYNQDMQIRRQKQSDLDRFRLQNQQKVLQNKINKLDIQTKNSQQNENSQNQVQKNAENYTKDQNDVSFSAIKQNDFQAKDLEDIDISKSPIEESKGLENKESGKKQKINIKQENQNSFQKNVEQEIQQNNIIDEVLVITEQSQKKQGQFTDSDENQNYNDTLEEEIQSGENQEKDKNKKGHKFQLANNVKQNHE